MAPSTSARAAHALAQACRNGTRERTEDIRLLVNYFLKKLAHDQQHSPKSISSAVIKILEKYHWPGNIRELENLIKRYVILGNEEGISSELVARPPEYSMPEINYDGPISLKKITRQATRVPCSCD